MTSRDRRSEHVPKTAALLAYAEGLLSPAGHGRVERHLESCEICRRELAAMGVYEGLLEDVRQSGVPAVDFDRIELVLAREARRVSAVSLKQAAKNAEPDREARATSIAPWALAGAAAAAALFLWVAWPRPDDQVARHAPSETAVETDPAPSEPRPGDEAPRLSAVVTLTAGAVFRLAEETLADGLGERGLAVGDALEEGEGVRTDATGLLHLRMSEGTGLIATADTELTLSRLREDEIRVTLARGAAHHHVATLASGSSYIVLAGGHEVHTAGARFVVSFVEPLLDVEVTEGAVEVVGPGGDRIELTAPARWRSDGSVGGERAGSAPGDVRHITTPEGPLTEVTLAHPGIVRWEIDGTSLEGVDGARLGVAQGEHAVRGWDMAGRLFTGLVRVDSHPVAIDGAALRAEAPRMRPGHLDEADIARVLQRGSRQIQSCYEGALRRGSGLTGRVRLRVTVNPIGGVRTAQVLGLPDTAGDGLSQCISSYASRWSFPPPGGPVTFEVPLNLATR